MQSSYYGEFQQPANALVKSSVLAGGGGSGNFNMKAYPTRPQNYLSRLGIHEIWRFILTHPDMDHLDGFATLLNERTVHNFWDTGADKPKPDFSGYNGYKEEDWDRYISVRDGKEGINSHKVLAGDQFKFANADDNGGGGDGLRILAPTPELVDEANDSEDFNDCSYVVLYRTGGFKIIFSGDSHDGTWEHILENHNNEVADCDILIAPHHGRHSGRSWDFLDVLRPRLTLFGVANSDHLAYSAWSTRGLEKITNNQAGNVVLDVVGSRMHVYVENDAFAQSYSPRDTARNALGYRRLGYVDAQS